MTNHSLGPWNKYQEPVKENEELEIQGKIKRDQPSALLRSAK